LFFFPLFPPLPPKKPKENSFIRSSSQRKEKYFPASFKGWRAGWFLWISEKPWACCPEKSRCRENFTDKGKD